MSLEGWRAKTLEGVRNGLDKKDSKTLLDFATQWFDFYKKWEGDETWERAFLDNRMTVRIASAAAKKFDVKGHPVMLNATVQGALETQDPAVFLEKRKNDAGLHDVAAVLLRGSIQFKHEKSLKISTQAFTKMGEFIFMPIPLEEDLQLFYELNAAANQDKEGDLKKFVVQTRAKMTRLKYGDPNDMMAGFGIVKKDGEEKVRYGVASLRTVDFPKHTLEQRTRNALFYKSLILPIPPGEGNNEVTMKVRHHSGDFPWVGLPKGSTKIPSKFSGIPPLSFLIKSLKSDTYVGVLEDSGKFHPMPKDL